MTMQSTAPQNPAPSPVSSGIMGYFVTHKMIAGIIGIAVCAVLSAACVVGSIGTDMHDFIMEDASEVLIINIAAILASEEIPGTIRGWSDIVNTDDPQEWKDDFMDSFFVSEYARYFMNDVTFTIDQWDADGDKLGREVIIGNFDFADARVFLEDYYEKPDEYRGFEVFGSRNVAVLEGYRSIVRGERLVMGILRSLDTGK